MSWVTWEPKSTIRTFSCMDGDVSRTYPELGVQRPFGAAFCGLCTAGSSLPDRCSASCAGGLFSQQPLSDGHYPARGPATEFPISTCRCVIEIGRAQSELQSLRHLVCRLLLEKTKQ